MPGTHSILKLGFVARLWLGNLKEIQRSMCNMVGCVLCAGSPSTNSDGADPYAGVVLSGNTLYGTVEEGGSAGRGAVFAVDTDGTQFRNLDSFRETDAFGINSDGAGPKAGLFLSGNTLYGTAYAGGSAGNGTVFAVGTDGTGFATLHSFTKLAMPVPQLTIALSGASVVLAWSADTGPTFYSLESATDFVSLDSMSGNGVWNSVSVRSVMANGQNIVTLPAAEAQRFYRLSPQAGGCGSNGDCPVGSMCVGGVCMVVTGGGGIGFGFHGFNGICSGCQF